MAYNRKEEHLAVVKQPREISNSLLETIDYIASARDAELLFDKTVIAEIISLNNADTGEYFVEYQRGKFRAYTPSNLSYVYPKGTNVYVKIPGGDFTQKKIIEGKVSATSYSEEEYANLSQQIIDMGEIYTDSAEYGILAYAPASSEYYEKVIYENDNLEDDLVFSSLLANYPNIMISADFKTQFYGTTVAGNYGLKIEFQEKETGITYIRRLDITNFSGSIYDYEIYSPQYAIYNLSNYNIQGIKKITFFQERFLRYDTVFNIYNEPIKIYDTDPNIFVQNIRINFVDIQDSTKDLYYVGISAPQGLSLIKDSDEINLKGVLYYAGKDIMDQKSCECYWYKQNPSILSGNEGYDKRAGAGWELIKGNDFNNLTITGKDVYQQMRYKLVVVYNSTITLSKDVRVIKYYNERFTIIRKDVSNTEVKLTIVDAQEKVNEADWYVDLLDGSYLSLAAGTAEINISQYLDYGNIIFYSISHLDNGDYVPCEYQINTYIQNAPVRVVFDGNDAFQYDANGSISYDQSITEVIIKPIITVDKNNVGVKSVTWYNPDGGEIFEYPTTKISNSMISKIWIDKSSNAIHYTIRQKYNANYTNNTLSLKIITLTGKEFYFSKTIVFSKQGEYEINGLDYSLIIKQCSSDGNEIGIQPLNYINNKYIPIYYKVELRLDGEKIVNGTSYRDENGNILGTYNIDISCQDINIKSQLYNKTNSIYQVTEAVENADGQYFLRFDVSIGIKNHEASKSVLHFYQPIIVSKNIDITKIKKIAIPSKITYSSDGVPSLKQSDPLSFIYNNIEYINKNTKSLTNNIIIYPFTAGSNKGKYYLSPINNYEGAYFVSSTDTIKTIPMGALSIKIDDSKSITYPIVMLSYRATNISDNAINGTNVSVVNEQNLETTKPIQVEVASGNEKSGKTYIGNGLVQGQMTTYDLSQTNNFVSGIYQYTVDEVPVNVMRADGYVKLGGDAFVIDERGVTSNDANILTTATIIDWIKLHKDEVKQILEL